MQRFIYRIAARADWEAARQAGVYRGAAVDVRDGYLHFSTADQVAETLALHYAGQRDLVLLTVAAEGLPLRWEPARGGTLFPHLYADLPVAAVVRVQPIDDTTDGRHVLPALA